MPASIILIWFTLLFLLSCNPTNPTSQAINPAVQPSGQLTALSSSPSASRVIFRSMDEGVTWQDISSGLSLDSSPTAVYAHDGALFLGTTNGIYSMRTGQPVEAEWQRIHVLGLIQDEFIAAFMPDSRGTLARTIQGGLIQHQPQTGMWQPVLPEITHKEINAMITCPDGIRFITTNDGIYRSVYGAGQWGKVFTQGQVLNLVETNGVLLGSGEIGVVRSTDQGNHWSWVLTEDGRSRKVVRIDQDVYAISLGGGSREQVQADPLGTASRLRRSADGGQTWKMLDPVHVLGQRIHDIQEAHGVLYCSSSNGLFQSRDRGTTWHLIRPLSRDQVYLAIATDGQVLYAIEVGDGC